MPKFKFEGEEFEADRITLREGILRIETDAVVVAAIGAGGHFSTEIDEGVRYVTQLPSGQLEFTFDPGYESVSVVFGLGNLPGTLQLNVS